MYFSVPFNHTQTLLNPCCNFLLLSITLVDLSENRRSLQQELKNFRLSHRFWSTLFLSCFQASLNVVIIVIDVSEKHNRCLGWDLLSLHVIATGTVKSICPVPASSFQVNFLGNDRSCVHSCSGWFWSSFVL